jgi:hypothetical protein
MAIRCRVYGCKFNNHGWCTLDYIEIDEHGKCEEILPRELKCKNCRYYDKKTKLCEFFTQMYGEPDYHEPDDPACDNFELKEVDSDGQA